MWLRQHNLGDRLLGGHLLGLGALLHQDINLERAVLALELPHIPAPILHVPIHINGEAESWAAPLVADVLHSCEPDEAPLGVVGLERGGGEGVGPRSFSLSLHYSLTNSPWAITYSMRLHSLTDDIISVIYLVTFNLNFSLNSYECFIADLLAVTSLQ